MTNIDPKRAREVADRIEAYGTIGPRGVERPEAASLIRSLCEREEAAKKIILAQEHLLSCYRLGRRPTDKTLENAAKAKDWLAAAEKESANSNAPSETGLRDHADDGPF
jgi:hypothetical protein